jgi:hypothetical protein
MIDHCPHAGDEAVMRQILFSFVHLLCAIAGAQAQSATTAVRDFGLIGKWAIECTRPPSPANEHALYAVTSSGMIWVMNDFGPDYDGMVYRVVNAERVAPDKLSLRQVLTTDDNVMLDVVMVKDKERVRVWSSRMADGNTLVRDGMMPSVNDQVTRWASRCEERRAGGRDPAFR